MQSYWMLNLWFKGLNIKYALNYIIVNCMEQRLALEADTLTAGQENVPIYGTWGVNFVTHYNLDLILSQFNTVHTLTRYLFKIYLP